jgi:hypothetical protein
VVQEGGQSAGGRRGGVGGARGQSVKVVANGALGSRGKGGNGFSAHLHGNFSQAQLVTRSSCSMWLQGAQGAAAGVA